MPAPASGAPGGGQRQPRGAEPARQGAAARGGEGADHDRQDADDPGEQAGALGPPVPQAAGHAPAVQLAGQVAPGRGEVLVVAVEVEPVPAPERHVEHVGVLDGARAGAGEGDGAVVLVEVDGAVDGGLDEPGHLVLLAHLLGEDDAALLGADAGRRGELGGGHPGQLGGVDPHLGHPGPRVGPGGVGGVGLAARGDPLPPRAADHERGRDPGDERRGARGRRGGQQAGPRVVGRRGGRLGRGGGGGQGRPDAALDRHALALGHLVDHGDDVAGLDLGELAALGRPRAAPGCSGRRRARRA